MSDGPDQKFITWNGSKWVADELYFKLDEMVDGVKKRVDIDKASIKFDDREGWLTMGTPVDAPDRGEKVVKVPILVKESAKITPPGGGKKNVEYHPLAEAGQMPREDPQGKIKDTVTVRMKAASRDKSGALIPATEKTKERVGTKDFEVKPPVVNWHIRDHNPVRLSKSLQYSFDLYSDRLPEGWLGGVTVYFSLSSKSINLLKDPGDPAITVSRNEKEESDTVMAARLNISDFKDCFTIVDMIPERKDKMDTQIGLVIGTGSTYLGGQINDQLRINAQALDVAVYFKAKPAGKYEWNEDTTLLIIPKSQKDNPPAKSCLNISLEYSKGRTAPLLRWCCQLGEIVDINAANTVYRAPLKRPWKDKGMPPTAGISCRVGDTTSSQSKFVPMHEKEQIYESVALDEFAHIKRREVTSKPRKNWQLSSKSAITGGPSIWKFTGQKVKAEFDLTLIDGNKRVTHTIFLDGYGIALGVGGPVSGTQSVTPSDKFSWIAASGKFSTPGRIKWRHFQTDGSIRQGPGIDIMAGFSISWAVFDGEFTNPKWINITGPEKSTVSATAFGYIKGSWSFPDGVPTDDDDDDDDDDDESN